MAPSHHQKKVTHSLSAGRPKGITPTPSNTNLSRSKSRKIIHDHHVLTKLHAQAVSEGNHERAAEIQAQLDAQGGLERYQVASRAGQSADRGGDSSKVLMEWLESSGMDPRGGPIQKLRMLEVGALSTDNACSRSGLFDVTRIDLNAQSAGITKQDFMERPLPTNVDEQFDYISLSLVLNFVPDPSARGEMLKRVGDFLKVSTAASEIDPTGEDTNDAMPGLFLVLPAACVANSRYLNEKRLTAILESLGYRLGYRKLTAKLFYYLWAFDKSWKQPEHFRKMIVYPGRPRNNFAIVLE